MSRRLIIDSFIIEREEARTRRALRIIQAYITFRSISREEAISRGHKALEDQNQRILDFMDNRADTQGLTRIDRTDFRNEWLTQAKKDWIKIVTDLFAL